MEARITGSASPSYNAGVRLTLAARAVVAFVALLGKEILRTQKLSILYSVNSRYDGKEGDASGLLSGRRRRLRIVAK